MFFAAVLASFFRDRFHLYVARSGTKLEKTSFLKNIKNFHNLEKNLFFEFCGAKMNVFFILCASVSPETAVTESYPTATYVPYKEGENHSYFILLKSHIFLQFNVLASAKFGCQKLTT